MKPILFPEGQTSFNTNVIGRLPDAISCTVTEERNRQYELHMEYHIDGQLMGEIHYSRIIVATPADNKSPQPFRIYRISKPLSGVVEIDAETNPFTFTHEGSFGEALAHSFTGGKGGDGAFRGDVGPGGNAGDAGAGADGGNGGVGSNASGSSRGGNGGTGGKGGNGSTGGTGGNGGTGNSNPGTGGTPGSDGTTISPSAARRSGFLCCSALLL